MKTKIILSFVFFLTSISFTYSQGSDHLVFKGVPIDGTLDEYVSKMKEEGFSHIKTENGTALLNGDFAGYKDCIVGVSILKQKDLVYKIGVLFPDKETWSTLSGNYFDLKEMLIEKYGKPSDDIEKFDVPSYSQPRDDNDKMYKVKFDNCKYYSIWKTDKGEIQLSIEHESVSHCFVRLSYFDKINSNIIKAKAKRDL
ncbi:hypothetical protein DOS84_11415 [Flavobacterium aquariorum]|uniref:Uncharacterized protein n=1 Tax=Flavobacterium aquariorum TaxID=2217670 RepID=A0A2W7TT79_9FLAO|nr:hypothetical protein [Flavobacterium aquariorum]PZX93461.1 hypothetical protein DOS84_11415 [Flavobacterium aquariorum]